MPPDCLAFEVINGRVFPMDGSELKPWDVFRLKDGKINIRKTDKVGLHANFYNGKGLFEYVQILEEGKRYCLSSLEPIKEILRQNKIPESRIKHTGKDINGKSFLEVKDEELIKEDFLSDGKRIHSRRYSKCGRNILLRSSEFIITDYTYVIKYTLKKSYKSNILSIERIFINQPNTEILAKELENLLPDPSAADDEITETE